jgi:prophage regulatory protein
MEGIRLIRLPEVEDTTGLKKSAIYARIKEGHFPGPVRLGAKAVAWRFDEIQQWIDQLPRATTEA